MKTRALRRLGIVLGILILVVLVFATATPLILDLNRYHAFIVSEIETAVGGEVSLGHISWGITHQVWLEVDELSISDATAFPGDIRIIRVHADLAIPQLLTGKVVLKNLQVNGSEVNYRLEPVSKDSAVPAGGTQSTGSELPVEVEIQKLVVSLDRLELDDALSLPGQTLKHIFSNVELAATNVAPTGVMTFNLSLEDKSPSGLGTMKARGTFSGLTKAFTIDNANLNVKASLSNLHVDSIKPYLGNEQLSSRLAGTISTEFDYEGDLGENLHARGTIDLSEIMYSDPSLWNTALPGQATAVTFQANLDPQNFTAEKISLKLGTLTLDARGLLHSWRNNPVIRNAEFSSNLPMDDVIPLIPWKQLGENAAAVGAMLHDGGTITLNKLTLPEISLSTPPELTDLVNQIEMTAQVAGVSIQPASEIPIIENIDGTIQLANGLIQAQVSTARMASIALPPVSARISNLQTAPKIDVDIHGPLALNANADEKFRMLLESVGLEKALGEAELDLTVGLETARPSNFQLSGDVELKDVQIQTLYSPALLHRLNAKVTISPTSINIVQASAHAALSAAPSSPDAHFALDIQGHIDGWRSNPSVTLRNFKTSRIALPLLSSMVPWGKMDQSAKPIKDILDGGGTAAIEGLSFPAIELSNLSEDPKGLLPRVKLAASLTDITVPRGLSPAEIRGITGHVDFENNVLVAENVHSSVGPIALPSLNIRATDIADKFKVALRAKGPLRVAAGGDRQIEKLLLEHELESLALSAQIDVSAAFDQHKPEAWTAKGLLLIDHLDAKSHRAGVVLEGLKGRVMFNREHTINITMENISARFNQASARLSGRILDIGSPGMLVSMRAFTRSLNLSHVAEFIPALREIGLEGVLDMDLNAYVPFAEAAKTRLEGTLSARNLGFHMASPELAVSKGNVRLKLIGDGANIESMTLEVNDQKLALSGQVSNPVDPSINLLLTSPDLNLDRLLPQDKAGPASSVSSKGNERPGIAKPAAEKKADKRELPPALRKLTAELKARADRGQYKGLQFNNLQADLSYKHGDVKNYFLGANIDDGHIAAKGSADLRNLNRIAFTVEPDISKLPLNSVAPALGFAKLPIEGPLTLTGQLRGHTGSTEEILESLEGTLAPSIGPGHINKLGYATGIVAKMSVMTHMSSLFTGRLFKDLDGRGIPYESISAQCSFEKGTLAISKYHLNSDALAMDAEGKLNLRNMNVDIQAILVPMAAIDEGLHYIPLVGVALEAATKVRINIDGPLKHPEIHTAELRQLGEGIESGVESVIPKKSLKTIGQELEKEL